MAGPLLRLANASGSCSACADASMAAVGLHQTPACTCPLPCRVATAFLSAWLDNVTTMLLICPGDC